MSSKSAPLEKSELRIVLAGITGVGKSAAGNTILRRKVFKSKLSCFSVTEQCQWEIGEFEGQKLAVIDTPGLLSPHRTEKKVKEEIIRSSCLLAPGPRVILVVIQLNRFTKEEKETVKILQEMFGEKSADYMMVLFTHGDDLEEEKGLTMEEIICQNPDLIALINQFNGQYHVFNNRDKNPSQVRGLMKKINEMVGRENPDMKSKEARRQAERKNHFIRLVLTAIGALVGALIGLVASLVGGVVGATVMAVEEQESKPDLRIVLVGKTGVGKSAAGNTILRKEVFQSTMSSSSVTAKCKKETGEFEGQNLAVIDTPGLFDTNRNENEVKKEIAKSISFSAPGPHVILVVLQSGRFTEEEKETVKNLQKMFGKKSADYMMVLFTRGDDLEKEDKTIEKVIGQNQDLRDFINQCPGGYHVFNNRNEDSSQVKKLLNKISKMVERNGREGFYTNKMFVEAERAIREEMERLLKEYPLMSRREARRRAENDNSFIRRVLTAVGAAGVAGVTGGLVGGPVGAAVGAVGGAVAVAVKEGCCVVQ